MNDPTFIGPVARERTPDFFKPGTFKITYACGLVQGASYVPLSAPTRAEALALRAEYVVAGAEPVPTNKLLQAIADALKAVAASPVERPSRRVA